MTKTPEIPVDWRVWQEPEVATHFVNETREAVPGAKEQLEILRQLLPLRSEPSENLRVLDLGCGDGILLESALYRWQKAQGVALDGSETMLNLAKARFAQSHAEPVQFVLADFNDPAWRETLPYSSFDAIISGYSIHHSEDDRKRELYTEIFDLLRPGGVFVNVEHVASATPLGEALFAHTFANNLFRKRMERGEKTTLPQILEEFEQRLDHSANRLVSVETQVQWLREIGYTDADCYWKYYELAIFAGYRPL